MGIIDFLFGAEPLADSEDSDDMDEVLQIGDKYDVQPDGSLVIYPGDDEDPDQYDESNSNGFW